MLFTNENLFQKYFEVSKKTFIPSVNSQIDKNFEIGLMINPKHLDIVRDMIDKSINVTPFYDKKEEYKKYVIENKINIQTRHDCDDIMLPNYIEHIHKLYEENKNKMDDFILNFHPTKFNVEDGKEYIHSRDYSRVCSMFSSLVQKNPKHGVFDVMHDHLPRLTRNMIYIKRGFVKLGIHGNNTTSKISPHETLIG